MLQKWNRTAFSNSAGHYISANPSSFTEQETFLSLDKYFLPEKYFAIVDYIHKKFAILCYIAILDYIHKKFCIIPVGAWWDEFGFSRQKDYRVNQRENNIFYYSQILLFSPWQGKVLLTTSNAAEKEGAERNHWAEEIVLKNPN